MSGGGVHEWGFLFASLVQLWFFQVSSSSATAPSQLLCDFHAAFRNDLVNVTLEKILDNLGLERPPSAALPPPEILQRLLSSEREEWGAESESGSELGLADEAVGARSSGVEEYLTENSQASVLNRILFPHPEPEGMPMDRYRTYFDLRNMTHYRVINATLYFYVERRGEEEGEEEEELKFAIHVYRYLSASEVDTEPLATELRTLAASSPGRYEAISLTPPIRDWLEDPHKNFGLMIKASSVERPEVDLVRRRSLGSRDNEEERPNERMFVEISLETVGSWDPDDPFTSTSETCDLEAGRYKADCCRFPLEVDFELLGWDWIIAPKRYNAFYCAGQCGLGDGDSQYAHLSQQALGARGANPCCSPQRLSHLSVIYVDDAGNVRSRKMPNMIVQKCGCF